MRRFGSLLVLVALVAACSGGSHRASPTNRVDLVMDVKASNGEFQAVEDQLRTDPRVSSFRFIDQNAAYSASTKLFTGQRPTFSVQTPVAEASSFQIILRATKDASAVEKNYQTVPGVDAIKTEQANSQVSSP